MDSIGLFLSFLPFILIIPFYFLWDDYFLRVGDYFKDVWANRRRYVASQRETHSLYLQSKRELERRFAEFLYKHNEEYHREKRLIREIHRYRNEVRKEL